MELSNIQIRKHFAWRHSNIRSDNDSFIQKFHIWTGRSYSMRLLPTNPASRWETHGPKLRNGRPPRRRHASEAQRSAHLTTWPHPEPLVRRNAGQHRNQMIIDCDFVSEWMLEKSERRKLVSWLPLKLLISYSSFGTSCGNSWHAEIAR